MSRDWERGLGLKSVVAVAEVGDMREL